MAVYENKGCLSYKDKNGDIQQLFPITFADCVMGMEELFAHLIDSENPHKVDLEQLGVTVGADKINLLSGIESDVQEQLNQLSSKIDTASGEMDASVEEAIQAAKDMDTKLVDSFDSKLEEHTTQMSKIIDVKAKPESALTVELTADGWEEVDGVLTQNVTVNGATADNTIIIAPSPTPITSYIAYSGCMVLCSGQSENTLTFICATKPEIALSVNVVILNCA